MVRYSFTLTFSPKATEVHATGCRDLAANRLPTAEVVADNFRHTVDWAKAYGLNITALPCCAPRRMAAAGRRILCLLPAPVDITPLVEALNFFPVEAQPRLVARQLAA